MQPPSLRDLAFHALFSRVLCIERFEFDASTTFTEYSNIAERGIDSDRLDVVKLLPPEYPYIRLRFRCDKFAVHRFHLNCPGNGIWRTGMERDFTRGRDAIVALLTEKDLYLCHHCERGLFFPIYCQGGH